MPEGLLTVENLASLPVQIVLITIFVALTKDIIDRYFPIPTARYAYFVAVIFNILCSIALGASPLNWLTYFMGAMNGLWISRASGGINDIMVKPPAPKETGQDGSDLNA